MLHFIPSGLTVIEILCSVKDRSDKRAAKAATAPSQAEKIGYVPKSRLNEMKASGMSSTQTSRGKKGEALDEESRLGLDKVKQADAEIDQDLDSINNSLASLGNIAGQMRDEVIPAFVAYLKFEYFETIT